MTKNEACSRLEKQYQAKEKDIKQKYVALLAQEKQENRQDSAAIVESFKKGAREQRKKITELESTIKQMQKNNHV